MQSTNNLTEGNVRTKLLAFAFPFFLSSLIQNLYMTADMLIVQWVNKAAESSAVGIGGEVISAFTFLIIGFASGGTVLISQYTGAGKKEDVRQTIGTLLTLFAIASVVMTGLLALWADAFLILLKTPPESFLTASRYTKICMLGNFFIFEYNAVSAVLCGTGDSKRPLIFVAVSGCLNVVLDLIFVAGLGLGAEGSAIATVLSQAVCFLLSLIYLVRNQQIFRFCLNNLKPNKGKTILILKIGFPAAIQNSISAISFMFLTAQINLYGYAAAAAAQLAAKFNNIVLLPGSAMSNAMAIITGHHMGAKKYKRALSCLKEGVALSLMIGIPLFLLSIIFTPQFMALLARGEPEVIDYGTQYIRAFSVDYLLTAFVFSANGFVSGTGHTGITLISNTLQALVIRIPMAYLLSQVVGLGIVGIGLSVPAATLAGGIFVFCYLLTGRWKQDVLL